MHRSLTRDTFRICALVVGLTFSVVVLCSRIGLAQAGQTTYMTAPLDQVKAQLIGCTRLGQQNGNTYYFKPAAAGIGQIVKVLDSDQTKFAMVGVLINGKLTITPPEKADFQAVQDGLTLKQARELGLSGGSEPSPLSGGRGAAGAGMQTNANDDAERPGCVGSGSIVSYWTGSAWQPMTMAAHTSRETGVSWGGFAKGMARNPFNQRAGTTSIAIFKNVAATLTLPPKPVFCIALGQNTDPTILAIGSLAVEKDHREMEICAGACTSRAATSDDWISQNSVQAVDFKRISSSTVEMTPKAELKPGQYLLGGPPMVPFFDFGVGENVAQ